MIFPFTYSTFSFVTVGVIPFITTVGAVVSVVTRQVAVEVFPTTSVAVTVYVCTPSVASEGFNSTDQAPSVLTVAVYDFEASSESVTTTLFTPRLSVTVPLKVKLSFAGVSG